ncbi:MAG: hypothetical protein QM777_08780 [Pseudorhodoferax sp.]
MIGRALTGNETADELIRLLVAVRHLARRIVRAQAGARASRAVYERHTSQGGSTGPELQQYIAQLDETALGLRFAEIEIGGFVMALGPALDAKTSRERIFDALNVGLADRRSEEVAEHGDSTANLVFALRLENSATKCDAPEIRPLAWCCQRFFMNQMKINPAFDRSSHDMLNETFNGAFGEYRERPLAERLAGRSL